MKVSELSGMLLDAWVARAEGHNVATIKQGDVVAGYQLYYYSGDTPPLPNYSTIWADGGPIIDREEGSVTPAYCIYTDVVSYFAFMGRGIKRYQASGPTPLVAAMRAFVGFRFGAEVPEE
jgi:hypothetical protein